MPVKQWDCTSATGDILGQQWNVQVLQRSKVCWRTLTLDDNRGSIQLVSQTSGWIGTTDRLENPL